MPTHEVANQPPPLEGYNLFTSDRVLIEAVRREAAWADERVRRLGEIAGGEPLAWGRLANTNPPVLRTHDRYGNRIDEVEFHPAWHELMRLAVANELHALPWREPRPGAHAARAALSYVLAHVERGLSCFLLPRWLPDGTRNRFHIQRLKDKLGNRSNASSEVEFDGAWARLVGDEGRGVPTIIEMVNHTRLDCVIGAAATMRQAVAQATHHAAHRSAFGRRLAEQPLMQNVLADLAVESEAATVAMMRLARAYDEGDAGERHFARLATAVVKYWVCKRTPMLVAEALECLGGNGYVEESMMPRLYREAPLNSIWEGSGNVICLDVLRAMAREPESVDAFFAEVGRVGGDEPRLDGFVTRLRDDLRRPDAIETRARRLVEGMAVALQGSVLVRHGDAAVAEAFCASRLEGDHGLAFGTLPAGLEFARIAERARPLAV